eukprot:754066-Ditylum_brightwellii.AAC.1
MWAGPSSAAQQQKTLSHCDKEIICCVAQQDSKGAHLQGCQQQEWKFFAYKSLPPSNKVGQQKQAIIGPTNHCPAPTTHTPKKSGRSQQPHLFSNGGHQVTAKKRGQEAEIPP